MFRSRVGVERVDRHQRRDGADFSLEVAPARADRMADAAARARDQAGYLLDSCTRGSDDADVSAWDDVCESQRQSTDDRCSAIRSHHQKAAFTPLALERRLFLDRDIVGKNHDIKA